MLRFLQIILSIAVLAEFLFLWFKHALNWFSIALLFGLVLCIFGSLIYGRTGEWLGNIAGIIILGRIAAAHILAGRTKKQNARLEPSTEDHTTKI